MEGGRQTEQWLVGGDLEELLFSEHRGLVKQHLAAGSKQPTLNQSFTACPNRLTQTHAWAQKEEVHTQQQQPQTSRQYQTL